ncbi:hypothetical protein QFW96_05540 [Saccharopolyspora sp. TS4A08]|uniref:DUF4245 domain-containing protein n=1 Tax=Saccharopolyspora ipomoeae TaxID=3042027 RepID=A0ABT6PJ88_9PSEU|nr:hypothetical protein [Saccharopolyspora sp. TS4A08]MDI2028060.1 hypothetical protein [Saccharopolyspora sp. TS4A08]
MDRTVKRVVVTVVGVLALVLVGALVWWLVAPGEQRRVVGAAELVDVAPPALPGRWTAEVVDPGRLSSDWGAQEQATASWRAPEAVEVDYTVRRYASARWAGWAFGRVDPRGGEGFDETSQRFPRVPPREADDVRFVCGEIRGRPGACDTWWVDLRYGQYLVQVQSTDVPAEDASVPSWLDQLVVGVDAEFAEVVPRP